MIGIDPGLTGAIAILGPDGPRVFDMPVIARATGKGQQVNSHALYKLLFAIGFLQEAVIEKQSAMPKQGVVSVFSLGRSMGVVEGVLASAAVPYQLVTAGVWKRRAGLLGKDKEASRTKAIALFPDLAPQLSRKKDHGRAEALLIARYGVRGDEPSQST